MPNFYEFFAGGGMARAGLGQTWTCLFANDFDPTKAKAYRDNWGKDHLVVDDVATIKPSQLPGIADLSWASFPCQDLSLAGAGAGLKGARSGTFKPFWQLMKGLIAEERAPKVVVLENVTGALTSHQGKDFAAICASLVNGGYKVGALIVDAIHFLPQSRPRLFVIAARNDLQIAKHLQSDKPDKSWHSRALVNAYSKISKKSQKNWIWWKLPEPPTRMCSLEGIVEKNPSGVTWHTAKETLDLIALMNNVHKKKLEEARASGGQMFGTVYRRTRKEGPEKKKVQRAEVRFDGVAGCLRTPAGGSSRQTLLVVEGEKTKSRLLSPREAARLMGLEDGYRLPSNYNDAYHLAADGVAVPAVRFLTEYLIEPLVQYEAQDQKKAA